MQECEDAGIGVWGAAEAQRLSLLLIFVGRDIDGRIVEEMEGGEGGSVPSYTGINWRVGQSR